MKKGFTLAEVLITLAIIGVVAALTIPSVISNSQQQEFKTGLKKAVSVLNSAITMNMALDGESPYDNVDLFNYLQKHMAVIESTTILSAKYSIMTPAGGGYNNGAFYTTDGMRFEFHDVSDASNSLKFALYENSQIRPCFGTMLNGAVTGDGDRAAAKCWGCGSYGLSNNPDGTTKPPCIITVDVNGDRKPNPQNVNCKSSACSNQNIYKFSDPDGKKLTDMFSILITDREAIPYGIAAQKAMYGSQK